MKKESPILLLYVAMTLLSCVLLYLVDFRLSEMEKSVAALHADILTTKTEVAMLQTRLDNMECRLQQLDALYNVASCESGLVHEG